MGHGKKGNHAKEKMNHMDTATVDAIKANDYDAFVKAWTANKKTVPSQEEFNAMVIRESAHENLEKAVLANDYE